MLNSFIGSIMTMTADVYIQKNVQSTATGVIKREWAYDRTVKCKVETLKTNSSTSSTTNKAFDQGKNQYSEPLQLKMKVMAPMSKRWRVSGIKTNDGRKPFIEIDRYDTPDTIFEVTESHAVIDPLGNISYYEVVLQRVQVQNDNTDSE